jgi:hypothetical protein
MSGNAAKPVWLPTGYLSQGRLGHTATLLQDGRVLVTGGYDKHVGRSLSSAEIYDPDTARWISTGSMNEPRNHHTATLLSDGTVIVAGGFAGIEPPIPVRDSAELYSPATGSWSMLNPMPARTAQHTATLLADGRVLIADGVDGGDFVLDAKQWFDPATGQWIVLNSGPQRAAATVTPLGFVLDSQHAPVLVLGGYDVEVTGDWHTDREIDAPTAYLYDAIADTYLSEVFYLTNPRAWHTATQLFDGTVLLAGGGRNVSQDHSINIVNTPVDERFDPRDHQVTPTASMQQRRHLHQATPMFGGITVIVTGGRDGNGATLKSVETYFATPQQPTGQWTSGPDLNDARSSHSATLLRDGTILVAGGYDAAEDYSWDSAERLYPSLPDLSGCNPLMTMARGMGAAIVFGRRLLA